METAARNVIKHPSARAASPQQPMSVLPAMMGIIWMEVFARHALKVIAPNAQPVRQSARNTRKPQGSSHSKQKLEKLSQQSATPAASNAHRPTPTSASTV